MSKQLLAQTQDVGALASPINTTNSLNGAGELRSAHCLASLSELPSVVIYQRVVTPDEKIRYTYISEGCLDIFGVSAEQVLSDPEALFSRHSDEYKAKFRERLLAASKTLTTWDVEASIVSNDGRKKYTHAIARPEKPAGWFGAVDRHYPGRNPHPRGGG